MQHKHIAGKCISLSFCFSVLCAQSDFSSAFFCVKNKIESTTIRPSCFVCNICSDKLRKQSHWKSKQNSVSKLNNSQLICNKTAVTNSMHRYASEETQQNFYSHTCSPSLSLPHDHWNDPPLGNNKRISDNWKMKTYTKLIRNYLCPLHRSNESTKCTYSWMLVHIDIELLSSMLRWTTKWSVSSLLLLYTNNC